MQHTIVRVYSVVAVVTTGMFIAMTAAATPVHAALRTVSGGDLIKASLPAVYYHGHDGKRYVFPNSSAYFSWYDDFSGVITISDEELGAIPIGGNVTYKPGVKMVKITTDPKVYAVDAGGTLRWVETEAVAIALYGANWNRRIDDVPDPFFINYAVGTSITNAASFNPTAVATVATSISVDKKLTAAAPSTPASPPEPAPAPEAPESASPTVSLDPFSPSGAQVPSENQIVLQFRVTNGAEKTIELQNFRFGNTHTFPTSIERRVYTLYRGTAPTTDARVGTFTFFGLFPASSSFLMTLNGPIPIPARETLTFSLGLDTRDALEAVRDSTLQVFIPTDGLAWRVAGASTTRVETGHEPKQKIVGPTLTYSAVTPALRALTAPTVLPILGGPAEQQEPSAQQEVMRFTVKNAATVAIAISEFRFMLEHTLPISTTQRAATVYRGTEAVDGARIGAVTTTGLAPSKTPFRIALDTPELLAPSALSTFTLWLDTRDAAADAVGNTLQTSLTVDGVVWHLLGGTEQRTDNVTNAQVLGNALTYAAVVTEPITTTTAPAPRIGLDAQTPSGVQVPSSNGEVLRFWMTNSAAVPITIKSFRFGNTHTFPASTERRVYTLYRGTAPTTSARVGAFTYFGLFPSGSDFLFALDAPIEIAAGAVQVFSLRLDTTDAASTDATVTLSVFIPVNGIEWKLTSGDATTRYRADFTPSERVTGTTLYFN